MQGELDYLEEDTPAQNILKELAAHGAKLQELKWKMIEAEELFKEAKDTYDTYRCSTLPAFMKTAGMTEIVTQSGARIVLTNKYHCSPNKNQEDMDTIEKFLEKYNATHLVNKAAEVDQNMVQNLEDNNIPYIMRREINTIKLKSWIKDQLGLEGGKAYLSLEEIPACVHFVRLEECDIKC